MIDTYMQPKKCTIKMDAHNYIKLNKKTNLFPQHLPRIFFTENNFTNKQLSGLKVNMHKYFWW